MDRHSQNQPKMSIPCHVTGPVRIPEIVASYEALTTEKNKRGQDVIIYTKTMDDGITFYVEEIRLGRHQLFCIIT